jgi:hypothetical protein
MRRTFACLTEAAEARAAAGKEKESADARLAALRCADQAMDLLEFRSLAKLRDGRLGERPPSSLSEFTADETRFARALVDAGRAEEVRTEFAGASLAVAFARDCYAPALAGESIRETSNDDTCDIVSESACWRRLSFALRAVDAQRKLGALAVTWRPRGVVGETPGDAPGPGESLGATRAVGYAVPAALPKGTHRAFRAARGAFLRTYLDLLVARFAALGEGNEKGHETVAPRVAAVGAALRVEPLMLQFSVGGFRDLMAEDEAFVAAEADEDVREARRAGAAGETT